MREHVHPFMKQRTYWNNANTFYGSNGWVNNLVPWRGLISRVNRVMNS